MKSKYLVSTLFACWALVIIRPASGADWWPPFGQRKETRSPLIDGNPLVKDQGVSARSTADDGPSIWHRMGSGTHSAMRKTKNLFTFKLPKHNSGSKTVSQYPSWEQQRSAPEKSSLFGSIFRRKPKAEEPDELRQPSDWIAKERPGFNDGKLRY